MSSVIRDVSRATAHILFSLSSTDWCGCAYLCIFARFMENSYRQRENLRRQGQANNQGGGKGGGQGGATPLGVLGGGVAAL